MTNDQNQNNELSEFPAPPLFDEEAYATAQPVEPLNNSRISGWARSLGNRVEAVSGSTKLLILVIIAGLAIGAIASMLLYRVQRTSEPNSVFNEARIGISALEESDASQGVKADVTSEGSPLILSSGMQIRLGSRRQYDHARGPHRSKAYRFAVIK